MKNKSTRLFDLFIVNKKGTRSSYILPDYRTDFKKYSFSVISTNVLNLPGFINDCLKDNYSINKFKSFLKA